MNKNSPFYIRETPAQISCSFGRTSAFMLWNILDAHDGNLPADTFVCFQNTGEECEETLLFGHEIETRWNVPIIWLEYNDEFHASDYINKKGKVTEKRGRRDFSDPLQWGFKVVNFNSAARKGEPFDKMISYYLSYREQIKGLRGEEIGMLPGIRFRMCTSNLKIKTATRFMQTRGHEYFDNYIGIRYDEPKRWSAMLESNEKRSERFEYVMTLWKAKKNVTDVLEFWGRQPFDLALDPKAEEGNCRYCYLKNTGKITKIIRRHLVNGEPNEELRRWLGREERTGRTFRKSKSYRDLVQIAASGAEIVINDEPVIDCICGSPAI